mmetsp:Transcript_18383/g.58428  ORF Transcript_18383/g.58428 Transcript_18383/m.58428 type:complete len:293 (-) Transcript_18383:198-1076(-)
MAALRLAATAALVTSLLRGAVCTQLSERSFLSSTLESAAGAEEGAKPVAQPMHVLIICNAYASEKALHVTNMQTLQTITGDKPLPYKECRDLKMPLHEGDLLDFKAGGTSVGFFRASGLPKSSSSLLLVPHRKDDTSGSLAFESHVFRELQNPQVAVVDAYRGEAGGRVRLADAREPTVPQSGEIAKSNHAVAMDLIRHLETLSFSSVMALNPGTYKVVLQGNEGSILSMSDLQVQGGSSKFIVLRMGSGSKSSKYPQELLVHTHGIENSAAQCAHSVAATAALLLALFVAV